MPLRRAAVCLMLLYASSAHAGWYEIRNYAGTVGNLPVHMSLQTYDHINHDQPGQWRVDGSYYYDAHRIPIALQGHREPDGQMVLCEALEPVGPADGPSVPAVSPRHPVPCPIKLQVTDSGATGEWNDSKRKLLITLRQVGSLDNTGSGAPLLSGTVEIPMWHHTQNHMLLGIYQLSKDCPISMVSLRLVNIADGKLDKDLALGECYGTIATSIYAGVYRAQNPRHVNIIAPGGIHGMGVDQEITIEP